MRDDGDGGDEETPEVAATAALEGDETEDNQLNGIIPGDSSDSGKDVCSNRISDVGSVYQRLRDLRGDVLRHERKGHIAHGKSKAHIRGEQGELGTGFCLRRDKKRGGKKRKKKPRKG